METFILDNIAPGSTIATDGYTSYQFMDNGGGPQKLDNVLS
jgi:hypothetical protein